MRVVCDNCGASYRIPEHKLVRDVNKATCRKCGDPMIIHKRGSVSIADGKSVDQDAETQVTDLAHVMESHGASIPVGPNIGHGFGPTSEFLEDLGPPTVAQSDSSEHTIPRPDLGPPTMATEPVEKAKPVVKKKTPKTPKVRDPSDTLAELSVVMMANFTVIAGAVIMAWSTQELHSVFGLFIILWGAVTSLSVVVSSDRGRRAGALILSTMIGLVLAGGASYAFYSMPQGQVSTATEELTEVALLVESEEEVLGNDLVEAVEGEEPLEGEEAVEGEDPTLAENVEEEPESTNSTAQVQATTPSSSSTTTSGSGRYGSDSSSSNSGSSRASSSPSTSSSSNSSGSSSSSTGRSSSSGSSSSGSSSSGPPAATGVSLPVLDTMLRTNRNVKQCFIDYRNETGVMPSGRIYVRIRISPSGRPASASINSGEYAGTSLDECLGLEIQEIQFPPFEGETTTYNYPFQL